MSNEKLTSKIEILEDGKIKAVYDGETVYLQPMIYVDTYQSNQRIILKSAPHDENWIRVDVTIEEIDGVSFSGTFAQLETALRNAAKKSNTTLLGTNGSGGGGAVDATIVGDSVGLSKEVTLQSVDTKLDDVAKETTLQAVDTVLDNIKLDTAKLDVDLSTRATEATSQLIASKLANDAAGAVQVSQKTILGNYIQDKDELPLLLDRVNSGAASQVWSDGVVSMSVGVGEYSICQSFKRHLYLAGKSQSCEITFNNFGTETGINKKVGLFSSSLVAPYNTTYDGFFLESDGTTFNLCIYKKGVQIASVPRASWLDPLDGTGSSGISIDFDNFTVMEFDYLYLGGTALRMSFNVGGTFILAHIIQNSSINPTTFVGSPAQPVRWEISSTTGTGSFGQICASVNTGGALDLVGFPFAVDTGSNFINANDTANNYLIAAIRPNNVSSVGLDIKGETLATTNDAYISRLILNPTFSVLPTFSAIPNSGFDGAIGNLSNPSTTTVTGGTLLATSFVGQTTREGDLTANSLLQPGFNINGTEDVVALCVQPVGSNLDIRGAINFKTL